MIEGCTFINAYYGAISFILIDENLTPNQTTIRNCLFQNNNNNDGGAAILFNSRTETNEQLSFNALFINNTFLNNHACNIYTLFSNSTNNVVFGAAIGISTLRKGTIEIIDSTFINNTATQSGGAIQIIHGESELEITLMNNNFDSNSAFSGGAVDFSFMNGGIVTLRNNTYRSNTALFGNKRSLNIIILTKYRQRVELDLSWKAH